MWFPSVFAHPARGTMQRPTGALKHLLLHENHSNGIAHLQFNRPPVNAMNLEFIQELNQWLLYLGSDNTTKAIVISSAGTNGIFTGGLDLEELSRPKKERYVQFLRALQDMWLISNTLPKPTVAAINGTCLAGGCFLTFGCDYRVMARQRKDGQGKPFVIGLNEAKLGLGVQPYMCESYAFLVGRRQAEKMLVAGDTPVADEALRLGVVDEVTADEDTCIETAFTHALRDAKVSPFAHHGARDFARSELVQVLGTEARRQQDIDATVASASREEVQRQLDAYIARLKNKPGK